MLILFTVVLLGAVARKLHLMNDTFDALLSKLVMTVALPGMILNSVLSGAITIGICDYPPLKYETYFIFAFIIAL